MGIRATKMTSTHLGDSGNLAMLLFLQIPALKCMEASRMVTDLLVTGQTCSVVFCRAALAHQFARMARPRQPDRA